MHVLVCVRPPARPPSEAVGRTQLGSGVQEKPDVLTCHCGSALSTYWTCRLSDGLLIDSVNTVI